MIKYCNTCKYSKKSGKDYENDMRCYNPTVNRNDYYMLAHINGSGYGSDCLNQRRDPSAFWSGKCGTQGKYWVAKSPT